MNRREFALKTPALGMATLWGSLPPAVALAAAPAAGVEYQIVNPAQATETKGKIEVLEFFWYGCPHCFRLEPLLLEWSKKLPKEAMLRRSPVAFRPEFAIHQQLFFALEAMGLLDEMHRKVFDAIHVERVPMNTVEQISTQMAKHKVDKAALTQQMQSFAAQTKAKRATQVSDAYKIDGVPCLAIDGRFITSGAMAGTLERSLEIADVLIHKARTEKR
jgi:thiol:disulfide interchange protein DsbA